jgi:predicted CopG family antitoxin
VHLVHQIPFICERATITLAELNTVAAITESSPSSSAERRKRLRLKRIVVSEHNYLALKRLGQAGDSFNDVISKLFRIHSIYQAKRQQNVQRQQYNINDQANAVIRSELPFGVTTSEMFDEHERQHVPSIMQSMIGSTNNQRNRQESNDARNHDL